MNLLGDRLETLNAYISIKPIPQGTLLTKNPNKQKTKTIFMKVFQH